ncbi:hypothetical protein [Kordiimonas gwangyangensis]|uniref:hypothetical protein n=1 Tax=Kordiimonas gwangyangensis TaxID=288022 RepID=UPI000364BDDA|nr:hypothetical protein [Kordiimonas gwangyangensis]
MKTLLLSTMMGIMATPVFAQENPFTTDHKPNGQTLACLQAPTRDCAFTSALQTVIEEEFGVERAKVLVGVASSMIETGQKEQAVQTLMLALDEARTVNISFVTQEKIKEIVPLLARAGDMSGALALTDELQNEGIKDTVLAEVAEEAIGNGELADARVALGKMQNRSRAFWRELTLLARAPEAALTTVNVQDLDADIRALDRTDQRYRGIINLAVIADRKGNAELRDAYLAEADELFPGVVGIAARAEATALRARAMYDAGMDEALVRASYDLAVLHGERLRDGALLPDFARKVGPVEAALGNLDSAIARTEYFDDVDAKAGYLASLRANGAGDLVTAKMTEVLDEVEDVEDAYERDVIRLKLLNGALKNANLDLAANIVRAMEDDDNQALALARMAPLLN